MMETWVQIPLHAPIDIDRENIMKNHKMTIFCFCILSFLLVLPIIYILKINGVPIYLRIILNMVIGVFLGILLHKFIRMNERIKILERNVDNLYHYINMNVIRSVKKDFKIVQ